MSARSARATRIELRAPLVRTERIRWAAKLENQSLSAFMLDAAEHRAEEVIAAASTTVVPARFFDELWSALDDRPRPSTPLARRARAKRRVVQR